jgi:hypothetical protein
MRWQQKWQNSGDDDDNNGGIDSNKNDDKDKTATTTAVWCSGSDFFLTLPSFKLELPVTCLSESVQIQLPAINPHT